MDDEKDMRQVSRWLTARIGWFAPLSLGLVIIFLVGTSFVNRGERASAILTAESLISGSAGIMAVTGTIESVSTSEWERIINADNLTYRITTSVKSKNGVFFIKSELQKERDRWRLARIQVFDSKQDIIREITAGKS